MSLTAEEAAELFRQAPDDHIDVGGSHVAYRRVGTGPDVLFVHGWPVSGATFRCLLPHLADQVTCHLIDLPGTGSSRWTTESELSIANHIRAVQRTLDHLQLDDVAVVGHDSGGMIARHAVAGDARVRAMGLINTEQPQGLSWRFRSFLAARRVPGIGRILGRAMGSPRLRRNKFLLGDAFADPDRLDGEFDEFFLAPIATEPHRQRAAVDLLRSFETRHIAELAGLHRRIDVPVQLVWGREDPFFPVAWAEEMVDTFPSARLTVIAGAGLFSHEEAPAEVAAALLPTLRGSSSHPTD